MLIASIYNVSVVDLEMGSLQDDCFTELLSVYERLLNNTMDLEEVCNTDSIMKLHEQLQITKASFTEDRTACLWFQYMEMVQILKNHIRAERTGNFDLHLLSLVQMLPFFAAAGHSLYTKCVRLHVQQMISLKVTNASLYESFSNGEFVLRRTDKHWGGLSPDLVIEQVLMRSLKTAGGLTHGRGMAEQQRLTWSMSRPICAEVNACLQSLTSTAYVGSDQHIECLPSRISRDRKDLMTIITFLTNMSPFTHTKELRNIASGVTAAVNVNVDQALQIGEKILHSMTGMDSEKYTFRKRDKVITLATRNSVNVNDDVIQIDPWLLFQRLSSVAVSSQCNMVDVFKFELCSYPPSLFDASGLLRQADKPSLVSALLKQTGTDHIDPPSDCQYVIDGGWLLQKIGWSMDSSYACIAESYVKFVLKRYKASACVVFDGYVSGPSTNDNAHLRRSKGTSSATVLFTENMLLKMKKEDFLRNADNKQRMINLISEKLELSGVNVLHAKADADYLIVMTSIEYAKHHNTVLIGEDTDLLVLLLQHSTGIKNDLYMQSEPKSSKAATTKVFYINILRDKLGADICENMLFLHAFSGCDTTSRMYGVSKSAVLSLFVKNESFRLCSKMFYDCNASRDNIIQAGEQCVLLVYKARHHESLASVRLRIFNQKVANAKCFVQPHMLPPTSAALLYHTLRVYLQVRMWLGESTINPVEWGWRSTDNNTTFCPMMTSLPPAPTYLLKIIHCNCNSLCDTNRCSCRKAGLNCTTACGNCQNTNCSNCAREVDVNDEDDDDDDNNDDEYVYRLIET